MDGDVLRRRLSLLLGNLLAKPQRVAVLIDGPSGSGKTTLARSLAADWPRGVQVVSLDSLYPGWDGLEAGSALVPTLLAHAEPGYWAWDWDADRVSGWVALDPSVDMIIEGCGALTPGNRALADVGVWVDAADDVRKERALTRDGASYSPHWERWAAQERAHWERNRPWELADVVLR